MASVAILMQVVAGVITMGTTMAMAAVATTDSAIVADAMVPMGILAAASMVEVVVDTVMEMVTAIRTVAVPTLPAAITAATLVVAVAGTVTVTVAAMEMEAMAASAAATTVAIVVASPMGREVSAMVRPTG